MVLIRKGEPAVHAPEPNFWKRNFQAIPRLIFTPESISDPEASSRSATAARTPEIHGPKTSIPASDFLTRSRFACFHLDLTDTSPHDCKTSNFRGTRKRVFISSEWGKASRARIDLFAYAARIPSR
ncbi:hypothetical protein G7K_4740-t1 [Saitoella complicata NRRL Y-17804]|uniref:Uncharacterized protein n=1 Tax=Saitoella complicata (strain BCRC 22490 / CBS 7301 / JCM 7358 / NBRC 10748 / NRRL Y-17804) TaxID=698492 RepID=A0A0E9NLR0_SAICN|nr:hypothetical protein G7K_4740-t1 [Saitoella complicata NRRL Y-17804]